MAEEARFIRGPETTALVNELRKLAPGESVTQSALSAAVGFDVAKYEGNVSRARDIVLREGGGVIDCTEDGWRRLSDAEAVNLAAERYATKARNAGGRGIHALTSVRYDGLADEDKIKHNVRLSTLGALKLLFRPSSRRLIESAVTRGGTSLPGADTLKLFERVK